jgi:hypothetical protein
LCRFLAASAAGLSNPTEAFLSHEPFVVDGVWVPKAILAIRSRYAVPLYLEIRKHAFETPECFPGVRRLAQLVGCAVGTVSALTDQFHALGIVKKLHDGRRCLYRFAQGCWRRRKARKSAHRSAVRTEERINVVDSSDKRKDHKNKMVSQPVVDAETRAKRVCLIRSLRRWVELSPALPDAERAHRLTMLSRAEAHLDDWSARTAEDKRCFDRLVILMRSRPLDGAIVDSLRQAPAGMPSIGAILSAIGSRLDGGTPRVSKNHAELTAMV